MYSGPSILESSFKRENTPTFKKVSAMETRKSAFSVEMFRFESLTFTCRLYLISREPQKYYMVLDTPLITPVRQPEKTPPLKVWSLDQRDLIALELIRNGAHYDVSGS